MFKLTKETMEKITMSCLIAVIF